MSMKIRVLIADDSADFRALLKARLEQEPSIAVIGLAADGRQLTELAVSLKPDVIIADTVLSMLDGLSALRQISQSDVLPKPAFFLLPTFTSPQVAAEAASLNVEYFMPKPCDLTALVRRIVRRQPVSSASDAKKLATQAIHDLGVPAHILGHLYLREAILYVMDAGAPSAVTKQLYPAVARKFGATGSQVERAIRHAIHSAWSRCDPAVVQQYFGSTISSRRGKPTNSEFISMIADRLRLQLLEA